MTFDIYYQHKIKNYFRKYWTMLMLALTDSFLAKALFTIYSTKTHAAIDLTFAIFCVLIASGSLFVAAFGIYRSFFAKNKEL